MSPACCARPLARLTGFACCVGYVSRGQAPCLLYAAPQDAGLSSCRGSRRGGISTRLQSERSYRRGGVSKRRSRGVAISGSPILRRRAAPTGCKVPDGVSHLFPCSAGALFPEANSLLLPLPVTPARAFFTMGDSPFFTTSASEFFIPLARAVFMTSETIPSHLPKASRARTAGAIFEPVQRAA